MCKATFVHHWKQSIKTQNCHCTAMTCFSVPVQHIHIPLKTQTDPETNSQLWPVLATETVSNRQQHSDQLQRQTNSTVTSYRDRQQRCDQCTDTDNSAVISVQTDNSTVTSMQPSVTCTFCTGCTCATLWCSHLAASAPQMTYKADCNCSVTVQTSPW